MDWIDRVRGGWKPRQAAKTAQQETIEARALRIPLDGFSPPEPDHRNAPTLPGIYVLLQAVADKLIPRYIGSAKNLRKRLADQLRDHPEATHVSWLVLPTESDALIMEDGYLKRFLPDLLWNSIEGHSGLPAQPLTMSGGLPGRGKGHIKRRRQHPPSIFD